MRWAAVITGKGNGKRSVWHSQVSNKIPGYSGSDPNLMFDYVHSCSSRMTLACHLTTSLILMSTISCPCSCCTELPRSSFQVPSCIPSSSLLFWCASITAGYSPETTLYVILTHMLLCALCPCLHSQGYSDQSRKGKPSCHSSIQPRYMTKSHTYDY